MAETSYDTDLGRNPAGAEAELAMIATRPPITAAAIPCEICSWA